MTRKVDRVTELRHRDAPAITPRPADPVVEAASLRDVLGIPLTMSINFGKEHGDIVDLGPAGALRRNMVRADWSPEQIKRNGG